MALLTPQRERSTTSRKEKNSLGYRGKIILRHPATLLGVLLLLVFGYLILAPVISLLLGAIQVGFGDEAKAGAGAGSLTGYYFERVFFSPVSDIIFYTPLLNTLWVSLCSMVIALALGVPVAWLLVRSNLPARRWFSSALIVPYMLPAWTFALAWTTIFRNRSNAGQQGWMETLGWEPPNWLAYGPVPIILIFSLHFTPFVILLVTNALKNLPGQLDEAAKICGAGSQQRWWRITLPLLRPALLSAATLMFAKAIGEFGVAYVLGLPTGFQVLSTTLHQSISTQQSGIAAVIAAVMVALGGISLLVDLRFLREAKRFTTLNGKATISKVQPLARWRIPALVMVGLLFTISVLIPLGTLVLSTIMRVPGDFSLQNFTADYWIGHNLPTVGFSQGVLVSAETWRAMWNTLWMVGLAALCTGLLGLLVGYVVVRSPLRQLGTALRVMTFMPYLVPGLAFAVAYLSLFAVPRGPIPALYGTATILILIMIADEMPFASRAGVSAMMQLGLESEEAAQNLGAKFGHRLRTVVLPMMRSSLASATLLPFVSGVQGLSLVIILATPGTELMTTLSMTLIDFGYTHAANAVVVLICATALLGTWATQKLFRSNLADSLG